jgi:type VI secretion system protein VasD
VATASGTAVVMRQAAFVALLLVAANCGKGKVASAPPPPPPAPVTIAASADVNPNPEGRASPVVVRIYRLKSDGAFSKADYEPLFDDEKVKSVLGTDLIGAPTEYNLTPSQRLNVEVPVTDEIKFVGVAALFRDIRNSEWRVFIPVAPKGMTVEVQRTRIVLTGAQ